MYSGDIGQQVKEKRNALGWSQDRLAIEAKVSRQTLVNLEKGYYKPRWETLEKIMDALDNAES